MDLNYAAILVVVALIVGSIVIAELNLVERIFQRKICPRCKGTMLRTGNTDPQPMHLLHDHKVELKCKRCGAKSWLEVAGKTSMGGD